MLLVSLPHVSGVVFKNSVILLHRYDFSGATGFILNKQYADDTATRVRTELNLPGHCGIFFGGPVNQNTGFFLHSNDYRNENTASLLKDIWFTPGTDILLDIAEGKGPHDIMLVLGHCDWSAGQLDRELLPDENHNDQPAWLLTTPTSDYFFKKMNDAAMWRSAIERVANDRSSHLLNIF